MHLDLISAVGIFKVPVHSEDKSSKLFGYKNLQVHEIPLGDHLTCCCGSVRFVLNLFTLFYPDFRSLFVCFVFLHESKVDSHSVAEMHWQAAHKEVRESNGE